MASNRPFALLAAAGLASLLALALMLGPAEGRAAAKCALGAEQVGCQLPEGTAYFADRKVVGPTGYVTTQVSSAGLNVAMHADINCKTSNPAKRRQARVEDGWVSDQKPRVGKTYKISDRSAETDKGVTTTTKTKLTITYKSAKQAVLSIHQVTKSNGKLTCDGSRTWRLKRS